MYTEQPKTQKKSGNTKTISRALQRAYPYILEVYKWDTEKNCRAIWMHMHMHMWGYLNAFECVEAFNSLPFLEEEEEEEEEEFDSLTFSWTKELPSPRA